MAKEKSEKAQWGKIKTDFNKENLSELKRDLEEMKKFLSMQKAKMEEIVGKLQAHGDKIDGDS